MKLLFLTQDFPPSIGGIQTYAASLADVFAEHCSEFAVMAPKQDGDEDWDARLSYPVHRIPSSSDWMRLKTLPTLLNVARKMRPDVILTGHWYVGAAALLARKLGYTKAVCVAAHAMELRKNLLPGPFAPVYTWHRKSILREADALFPVSRYTGGLLAEEGVARERIHVVPNGTEVERFDNNGAREGASGIRERYGLSDKKVLLTVSRLVPRKGVDTVLESLPKVIESHPDVHYLIVGRGEITGELRALSSQLNLDNHVTFTGGLPYGDLPSVYHACDIFVMPARQIGASVEGFGLVFCEANACGKPVIGGNAGGVPDAIIPNETGLLIEPNDPEACRRAIEDLLGDEERAKRFGLQGLNRVRKEGTWAHAGNKILGVMEGLCESS